MKALVFTICALSASTAAAAPVDGKRNQDYVLYGKPVVAAAAGVVRAVVDGIPDNAPGQTDDTFVPGNLVVIEHAVGEYAHYCHLQPGSARVKVGERVGAGQAIGLVGNSGNSSEPHLHFHVQDALELSKGVGLEPVFVEVMLWREDGGRAVPGEYHLRKGDVITSQARAERKGP